MCMCGAENVDKACVGSARYLPGTISLIFVQFDVNMCVGASVPSVPSPDMDHIISFYFSAERPHDSTGTESATGLIRVFHSLQWIR